MANNHTKLPAEHISSLAYVQTTIYNNNTILALADSGASISILNSKIVPEESLKNLEPCDLQVAGVTGSELKILGKTFANLSFSNKVIYNMK